MEAPTAPRMDRLRHHMKSSPLRKIEQPLKPQPNTLESSLPPLPPLAEGPLSIAPFIHPSSGDRRFGQNITLNYERLEFLGDAYLELFAVKLLYSRFPHLPVGRLDRLRTDLVPNKVLAHFAEAYRFGERMLGEIDVSLSDKGWTKMLADMFEAYVAAVVLSDPVNGMAVAEAWMTALWAPFLLEWGGENKVSEVDLALVTKPWKDILLRSIGGHRVKLTYEDVAPMRYTIDKTTQVFTIGVRVTGWGYDREIIGVAEGQNKKEAGMRAAEKAMNQSPIVKEMMERYKEDEQVQKDKRRREKENEPQETNVGEIIADARPAGTNSGDSEPAMKKQKGEKDVVPSEKTVERSAGSKRLSEIRSAIHGMNKKRKRSDESGYEDEDILKIYD